MKTPQYLARRRRCAAAVLACLLASEGSAEEPSPAHPWKRRFENTFAFVLNPLGIQDAFEVSWTKPINRSDAPLYKDAHIAAGVASKLTPAFERVGAWFEYSPLSILDLRVGVEPVYYFGTYDLTAVSDAGVNRKQDIGLLAVWSKSGAVHVLKNPTVAAKVYYFLQGPWRRHEAALQLAFVFGL